MSYEAMRDRMWELGMAACIGARPFVLAGPLGRDLDDPCDRLAERWGDHEERDRGWNQESAA